MRDLAVGMENRCTFGLFELPQELAEVDSHSFDTKFDQFEDACK